MDGRRKKEQMLFFHVFFRHPLVSQSQHSCASKWLPFSLTHTRPEESLFLGPSALKLRQKSHRLLASREERKGAEQSKAERRDGIESQLETFWEKMRAKSISCGDMGRGKGLRCREESYGESASPCLVIGIASMVEVKTTRRHFFSQ